MKTHNEFNLSEKIIPANTPIITILDVQEFIRELKENHFVKIEFGTKEYCEGFNAGCGYMKDKIDELAGDKLV